MQARLAATFLPSIVEEGVPPRFHLTAGTAHWDTASVETERPDGSRQTFALTRRDGSFERWKSSLNPMNSWRA